MSEVLKPRINLTSTVKHAVIHPVATLGDMFFERHPRIEATSAWVNATLINRRQLRLKQLSESFPKDPIGWRVNKNETLTHFPDKGSWQLVIPLVNGLGSRTIYADSMEVTDTTTYNYGLIVHQGVFQFGSTDPSELTHARDRQRLVYKAARQANPTNLFVA